MPVDPTVRDKVRAATQKILSQQNQPPMPQSQPSSVASGYIGSNGQSVAAGPGSSYKPPSNTPYPGMNAATSGPNVPMPNLGYGGASYGSNAATNKALEANAQYIKDPNNRQSEIDRTLGVIKNRQGQGLDISAQTKYLGQLGYKPEQRIDEATGPQTTPSGTTVPTPNGTFQYTPSSDTPQIPVYTPQIPVMDLDAIRQYAQSQTANKLKDLRTNADNAIASAGTTAQQQLGALQTQYDRQSTDINQDRGVENVQNARRLSPFSGRSDYAAGVIEQERARTDRQRQEDLASAQGNINQNLADFTNAQNNSYTNLANQSPDMVEALVQQLKGDERAADLAYAKQSIDTALANGQLSQQDYNQALSTWQTNFNALQQQIQNDAQYGGVYGNGRSLQGLASDLANKQANNDAAMGWSQLSGQILSPQNDWSGYFRQIQNGNNPLTLQGQQQQTSNNQWQQTFDRNKYESDRAYQNQVQQQAIANGQWQQQFNQDVQRLGFDQASQLWSQAFQENQANQDDAYRNQQLQQNMTESDRSAASQASNDIVRAGLVSIASDPNTGQQSVSVPSPDNLANYIFALNLSDDATDALLYQFGLGSYVKK